MPGLLTTHLLQVRILFDLKGRAVEVVVDNGFGMVYYFWHAEIFGPVTGDATAPAIA